MEMIIKLLKMSGYKTYLGALGLIFLGAYQCTEGLWEEGTKNVSLGIAIFGGRAAVDK